MKIYKAMIAKDKSIMFTWLPHRILLPRNLPRYHWLCFTFSWNLMNRIKGAQVGRTSKALFSENSLVEFVCSAIFTIVFVIVYDITAYSIPWALCSSVFAILFMSTVIVWIEYLMVDWGEGFIGEIDFSDEEFL